MRNILITILVLLGVGLPLQAQADRAMLSGTVTDQRDSLIPAARITVKSVATGLEYGAKTNPAGVYVVNSLPVGQYTAAIVADGFGFLVRD